MRLRSSRSPRVARSSIPFITTGRCTSIRISSVFEYSSRVAKPPPVESRQIASESHGARCETLS